MTPAVPYPEISQLHGEEELGILVFGYEYGDWGALWDLAFGSIPLSVLLHHIRCFFYTLYKGGVSRTHVADLYNSGGLLATQNWLFKDKIVTNWR